MTPTHAVKQGRRYRYYVSRPLITGARADAAAALRIPAPESEQIVIIESQIADALGQPALMVRAAELAGEWAQLSPLRMRVILLALLDRAEVHNDQVMIHLRPRRLADLLQNRLTAEAATIVDEPTLLLSHPVQLRRAGKEVRMAIEHTDPFAPPPKPDPALIRLVVRAHRFHAKLLSHTGAKFGDLARSEKLNRSYFARLLRIAYLTPDITTAILDGRQPAGLTATGLIEQTDLPISWREQRRALGFADRTG